MLDGSCEGPASKRDALRAAAPHSLQEAGSESRAQSRPGNDRGLSHVTSGAYFDSEKAANPHRHLDAMTLCGAQGSAAIA